MPGVWATEAPRLKASLQILDIRLLRAHEQTQPELLRKTMHDIQRDGRLNIPVLVERSRYVILDGHHRYEALLRLGCRRIPCYVVDYASDEIGLTTWPGATITRVTKEEVLDRGMRRDPFPPKTTRHLLREKLPENPVPLRDLM